MTLLKVLPLALASLLCVPVLAANTSGPDTAVCPADFYSIAMPAGATQCQRFDDELPASLVYHTPVDTQTILQWYQQAMPELAVVSRFNKRVVLSAPNNNIRVVVSPDQHGAQVDLLVIDTLLASQ
ncbi:hypothetical protein IT774_03175 [Salinimonas marina]|uniref:Uncharacterized protein n=1 Tax=Salinimonas marina TaxID=2785918 RepID=A0A7S9DYI9_9ALTE|nr:hypothetical protein [Salinimonas marina]QPG06225.1 hypothetical protein IT774_03175 [Salinimonas marina]